MYTQCPYCNTLFRVRVEQLRTARGKAHCSRCDNIFNALENLQDTAPAEKEEWPSSLFIDANTPAPTPPESPSEEIEIGSVEDLQDDSRMKFGSNLDFSSDPFPESGNIDLDLGEIEPEIGEIGSDFGETAPDIGEFGSSLEDTDPDLTELESELEDLVSELDELEAESEQHISLPGDPILSHHEAEPDSGTTAEEPEVGESTEIKLERLASKLGVFESEADETDIEDLVSELYEAESEQHLSAAGEPASSAQEPESSHRSEAPQEEPGVGESTEVRLEKLATRLEGFKSETDDDTDIEDLVSELDELETETEQRVPLPGEPVPPHPGLDTDYTAGALTEDSEVGESTESRLEELASQLESLEPEVGERQRETAEPEPGPSQPQGAEALAADSETGAEQAAPLEVDAGEADTGADFSEEEPITLEAALAAEEGRKRGKQKGRAFLTLANMLLILVLIGQASWLGRQQLLRYPEGRALLETVCTVAGCTVPAQRAPQRIIVLRRSMISHLEVDNALELNITFVNRAQFAQPLPQLEIILFNLEKKPVARRRFSPIQYLGREPGKEELLQPGQALEVEMEVEDPGKDVTGFKLDFY
jgi:predicted Zn finger-like uncharacterized protein